MAKFIPIDKMKKLREAARSGDERAKKILAIQLGGKEDFGSLIDEYFKPQIEETSTEEIAQKDSGLEEFLKFNGIEKGHPEYDSYVQDYYKENPQEPQEHECECVELIKKLMGEELDAINSYSKAITQIMACEELEDNQKRKIISRLEEIKSDEVEHHKELKQLLAICNKKEEIEENIEGTID